MAILGNLLTLCLLTFSAPAAMLFQDNFDSYAQGLLPTNVPPWIAHSGNPTTGILVVADPTSSSPNALQVSQALTEDVHANLDTNGTYGDIAVTNIFGPFTTNIVVGVSTNIYGTSTNIAYAFSPSNSVATLYSSYTIYVTTIPPGPASSETYFGHFYGDSSTFKGRLFLVTNGVATPGNFRIAIQNGGTAVTNTIPVDLTANTSYTLVTRYVLSTGSNTVWLNPVNETSGNTATPLDTASAANIVAYAFRQASTGEGVLDVDNLVVGTKFADVVPGSVNPPTFLTQPADTNVFSGSTAVFSTLAAGDATLGYQWFSITNGVTNTIAGATGKSVTLTGLTTNQTGSIFCVVTNGVGTNSTRLATLLVSPQPVPPTIDANITPTTTTNIIGDTVSFSVTAHGLPAPAFQWKFVPATNSLVTNIVVGVNASGTNTATLTLANITTNQAGSYFVTITNSSSVGWTSTNSAKATLTVLPPPVLTIADFRAKVDNAYAPTNTTAIYTLQGTVTTWTNMTSSSTSLEFYMQDNTGGIAVFWLGSNPTNLPPAGSIVRVTGAMAAFSGLLEIEPVFTNALTSVTVLGSTSLPAPQPLPFDPNITGNLAAMKAMESTYFVASNVTLTAGANFTSGANEPITANASNVLTASMFNLSFTNQQGQTFTLFINGPTDIPGKAKPAGPVTIYGILGFFTAAGFEFTPSRFEDIISYVHVTNTLTHARKGDLATNSYSELVLRSGETLNTHVSIGDAAGGTVTLTPITDGLSPNSGWSGLASGLNATGNFSFSPTVADAGSNYLVNLQVSSSTGTIYTNTIAVYVPTLDEQQIAISEFLANPTTNTGAPYFNPLKRSTDTIGISTNDQYLEIENQSVSDLGPGGFKIDTGNPAKPVFDANAGAGATVPSLSSLVVYGGNAGEAPGLATPVAISSGLFLPKTGSGVLVLRNVKGNIIDRVVYAESDLSTNGSLSRFPANSSAFVPQAYISTNLTTAGLQYDGGSWSSPTKVPAGVNGVGISYVNGAAVFSFTANTSQASTLWSASDVSGPYSVIFGGTFPTGTGIFTNVNPATMQFYFISTQ
ncbi:MAG TPA: immunoglobulin domain-containing protein [Verrucomicrobiae bacterium]|nr:immunoglobulin domain-containing protein [Verrucomicrobiae bacterium]